MKSSNSSSAAMNNSFTTSESLGFNPLTIALPRMNDTFTLDIDVNCSERHADNVLEISLRKPGRRRQLSSNSAAPVARGEGVRTSYLRGREPVFREMTSVEEIYLRGGEPTQSWHKEVGDLLARRYELSGWARTLFMSDWSMLKRVCGDRHPSEIFLQDLEDQVLRAQTQSSRESYVGRCRSVFNSLRMMGVIPLTHRPDDGLPKIKVNRASPRPLSREQVLHLISEATLPEKEWFTLAALTGMRACEVSMVEGSWLENHGGNWMLRIRGKGNTELLVPAHPKVVELIQSKKTLGKLYDIQPNYLSRKACQEMRRLGVMTKHNNDKNGSRLSFHSFRHFFATEMLRKSGGNLVVTSRLMRHASPIVTMRYADLINDEERAAVDLLFDDVDWSDVDQVRSVHQNPRYKKPRK